MTARYFHDTRPRVLALDPSLNAFGVCLPDGTCDTLTAPKGDLADRYAWYREAIRNLVADHRPDVVVFERSFGNANRDVSAKLGVLRLVVIEAISPLVGIAVAPASLKKAATGNGQATKDDMVTRARELGATVDTDDEADAWLLWYGHGAGWWKS